MKKNILVRTNILVCMIIFVGFLLTAVLSYRANYTSSIKNIEQVSTLTSEGIYYQMATTFTKPVNISLTMANDSLLKDFLSKERAHLDDPLYIETIKDYLDSYQKKYSYDSVFLVSTDTCRYYNFQGLDRVLVEGEAENVWFFSFLESDEEYSLVVDNDEVKNAGNAITVFVNCKIKDDSGRILGVVGVGLRIDYFQKLLEGYQKDFGVSAYLIDSQGTIQISSAYTGYEEVNLFDLEYFHGDARRQILDWEYEGMANSFWMDSGNLNKWQNFLVTRYLPELEWHLVVERDTANLTAKLNTQLMQTLLIISAIILIILFVITIVIRTFNRQIISLTQSIEQERRTIFEKATEQLFENINELDITHNRPANQATEQYFQSLGAPPNTPFDKALAIIAEKQIKEEFRQGYLDTFSPKNVQAAFDNGKDKLQYEFMKSNGGDYYWMRITAQLVEWESDGSLHMLVYRQNIDAEKRQESRMRKLAQTDEMTGLYTKTAIQNAIEKTLESPQEPLYAFFIFDIDCFKEANDLYGHAYGDSVIKQFVQVIRDHLREDDLIGRIGGDEFAAFLPIPDLAWAGEKARELSKALDQYYTKDEHTWKISASIGVSFAPRDGEDFTSLYQKADSALYQTKGRGKNGFTLYDG